MNTYRLSEEQFDIMESSFVNSGADFESSMSHARLYLNTINFEFLQVFYCVHDGVDTSVFEWTCTGYQTGDDELFLTDGYPRFGTYDEAVVMFIDAGATTAETAMIQAEVRFTGAMEAISTMAAGIAILMLF